MAEKANTAVKLDPEIRQRLQALGEAKRRSPHSLMIEAIRLYVEREEEIERARAETERLARYDATGEYILRYRIDEDAVVIARSWRSARTDDEAQPCPVTELIGERIAPADHRNRPPEDVLT